MGRIGRLLFSRTSPVLSTSQELPGGRPSGGVSSSTAMSICPSSNGIPTKSRSNSISCLRLLSPSSRCTSVSSRSGSRSTSLSRGFSGKQGVARRQPSLNMSHRLTATATSKPACTRRVVAPPSEIPVHNRVSDLPSAEDQAELVPPRTMPPSLLPRQVRAELLSRRRGSGAALKSGATNVWNSLVRGVSSSSSSYRRSKTIVESGSQHSPVNREAKSGGPARAQTSSSLPNATSSCYYYYYYTRPPPFTLSNSSSLSPLDVLAPFPPASGISPTDIAGFKLLLPIPIKRTIADGPRGPQLCAAAHRPAQEVAATAMTPAAPIEELTAASLLQNVENGTQNTTAVVEAGDGAFSDGADETMTIWSDTSSCVFSDDSGLLTTEQTTAPHKLTKAMKWEASVPLPHPAHCNQGGGRATKTQPA